MKRALSRSLGFATGLAAALLIGAASLAEAQNAVIRGTVRSDGGDPVAGANVFVVELNLQAATSEAGRYVITVPGDRVRGQQLQLRVRAICYRPSSRPVTITAGEQSVDFTLAQDVNRLEEIVVTGVLEGTEQTKVPFTVGRVDMADIPAPAVDPLRMLAGRVPGANIVSTSGRPGSAPSVILRGPTSINATGRGQGPLYIVDGVIINGGLPDINPSDIENVEVVKGASAASLYGARAGQGVIQITTRSGRRSADGMSFNVRVEAGQSDIERAFPLATQTSLMMDERNERFCMNVSGAPICARSFDWVTEAARVNNEPGDVALSPAGMTVDPGASIQASALPQLYQARLFPGRTYDAIEQTVSPGRFNTNTFDMTGRFNQTQVYASASGTIQQGAIRYLNGYSRYSGRVNVDQRIGSAWRVGLRTYYSRSKEDGINQDGGGVAFFRLTRSPAIANLLANDTLGRLHVRTNMQAASGVQNENPLYSLQNVFDNAYTDRFIGGVTAQFSPANWVDFEANVGYDMSNYSRQQFYNKGYRCTDAICRGAGSFVGYVYRGNSRDQNLNSTFNLSFSPNTGRDLQTRVSLRYLYEQQDYDDRTGQGSTLNSVGINQLNNASTGISITSQNQSVRQIGYFGGVNLEYKGRYIVDGLIRQDGSSLFGEDNRWQTFYRYSLAWRPSQESWWFASNVMNELKLRFSRGTAGGRPNFAAQYETWTVSASGPSFGTLGNRNLRPEVTDETEIGADFELFRRVGVTLTHAASLTYNQILQVPNPAEKGFSTQWQNAGTMQNTTWELAVNLPLLTRRDLSWSWQFTYDRTRTIMRDLYVPPFNFGVVVNAPATGLSSFFARPGEAYATFYGRAYVRSCDQMPDMSNLPGGADFRTLCGPGQPYQVNDEGFVVYTGGFLPSQGITDNLWGTRISGCVHQVTGAAQNCDRNNDGSITALDSTRIQAPWGYGTNWGAPMVFRDTVCARLPNVSCSGQNMNLGQGLPSFNFSIGQNFQWRRLTVYALMQASIGRDVWNVGYHWSHLDFITSEVDQRGKSVESAKPIGYYWRGQDFGGYGGFYDGLAPTSYMVEDASYAKLRELLVSYNVGPIANVGNWTFSLVGRNLFTITDYRGFDPEVGTTTANAISGSAAVNAFDRFGFPNTRSVTFALSTSF